MSPLTISRAFMANIRARTNILIGKDGNIPVDIITFHGLRDDKEHIALVFNKADEDIAPLVRLH